MINLEKLQKIFSWIYIAIFCHFLWIAGFVMGLGIFSIIPTSIATFALLNDWKHAVVQSRVKLISNWWDHFKQALKQYWWVSGIYSLIMIVMVTNYLFLQTQSSLISGVLFYVTLVILILFSLIGLWFSYLVAFSKESSMKEIVQNAIAYTVSRLREILIAGVLIIAVIILLSDITPGFLVFTGMGIVMVSFDFVFTKLVEGHGFHTLGKYWRRED